MASTDRRREIERFNEDLDRLIAGNDVDAGGEYEGLLDVAADLASSDFSRASGVRESLRARLLGGSAARRRAMNGSGANSAWTRVRLLAAPVLAALIRDRGRGMAGRYHRRGEPDGGIRSRIDPGEKHDRGPGRNGRY